VLCKKNQENRPSGCEVVELGRQGRVVIQERVWSGPGTPSESWLEFFPEAIRCGSGVQIALAGDIFCEAATLGQRSTCNSKSNDYMIRLVYDDGLFLFLV